MASVSLVLCDDSHIRTLNLRYRGKDAPTDVLSFEIDDGLDFKVGLSSICLACKMLSAPVPDTAAGDLTVSVIQLGAGMLTSTWKNLASTWLRAD